MKPHLGRSRQWGHDLKTLLAELHAFEAERRPDSEPGTTSRMLWLPVQAKSGTRPKLGARTAREWLRNRHP
jgi:hypothetical protein